MGPMSDNSKSGSALQTISVGIVLALIAGGSSPWWWSKVFPDNPPSPSIRSPRPPYMGSLEGGTSRQGSDLSSVGIQSNSAAECSDSCGSDPNCKAMTFVKHANANGGICWLKGSVATFGAAPAVAAALALERAGRAKNLAGAPQMLEELRAALAGLHAELAQL